MKTCLVLFAYTLSLRAQTQSVFFLKLDNGVRIAYQVWNGVESREAHAEATGHVVRRTLNNPDGSPSLGFNMHVDRASSADFLIWFDSAPGYPFFAEAPLPRHVRDGDRVMFNVLEQPGAGKKIFDSFQVLVNLPNRVMMPWPMDNPPSLLPAGTALRLSHPKMRSGGTQPLVDQAADVLSGSQIAIDVPLVGRFNLSSSPREGYYLDALATGSKIVVALEQRYEIEADAPIVERPGTWFLWVKYDPVPHNTATLKMEDSTGNSPPLAVTVDRAEAGLMMSVKNTSARNVLAYTIRVEYYPPNGGARMPGGASHSLFHHSDYLAPGQTEVNPKPLSAPEGATAVTTVDMVIFQDGSYWGPVTSRAAQRQLLHARQSGIVK